jgi:hypothetical protein
VGKIKNLLSLPLHKGNKMNRKVKFLQDYFVTIDENLRWYLILIETDEDDLPVRTFIIKMPEPDGRFKIYPYIKN